MMHRADDHRAEADLVRLGTVLVDQLLASFAAPPEELVLDIDATDDPVHGEQENRFFHGYYDQYCFLPLYVTCGSRLLVAYLRPSNIGADHHAAAILKLLITRLRAQWPAVRIPVRGDGGFCRWRLMRWCDSPDIRYLFGLPRNPALETRSAEWQAWVAEAHRLDGRSHRVFGTLSDAAKTRDRPRRVIVKAEHLRGAADGKSNPRHVVTNLAGDARALYEDVYCARGDSENRIEEQQLGLFADRTSCREFMANLFRVLLSAAAYVLVEHIRRTALAETALATAEVGTIRLRLFRVPGLVVTSVRRLVVRLSQSYASRELFALVAGRLQARALPNSSQGGVSRVSAALRTRGGGGRCARGARIVSRRNRDPPRPGHRDRAKRTGEISGLGWKGALAIVQVNLCVWDKSQPPTLTLPRGGGRGQELV